MAAWHAGEGRKLTAAGMMTLALRLAGGRDLETGGETDARLLTLAARKDQAAFSQLVRHHYQVVYRVVWRLLNGHNDAEDIAQEAFLRLWKDPAQVREASHLRSWLIRVATNLAMDRFRVKPTAEIDTALEVSDTKPGAEALLVRHDVSKRMDLALSRLPDRQRLALTLVQFEHMSNAEAAQVMDLTVDALESLLSRARRGLRQDLAGEWQDMLTALASDRMGER
jgi:RNA polymerase sigma-70 factor, ECF subfamily